MTINPEAIPDSGPLRSGLKPADSRSPTIIDSFKNLEEFRDSVIDTLRTCKDYNELIYTDIHASWADAVIKAREKHTHNLA